MKKIAAFFTAVVLFFTAAISAHIIAGERIDTNNADFGTWINSKKDLSYQAVSRNIEEDSVLMLGSSEFHHGKKTKYHPTAIFRSLGMNVMCIGAAKNQCLSHAITVGAIAPEMKNKKVVLILSPSWFSKEGIDQDGFSARFSGSMYEAFIKNESISNETRKAVAERVNYLLEKSPGAGEEAGRAEKIHLDGEKKLSDGITFITKRWFSREKELINVGLMWKATGEKNNDEYTISPKGEEPDWDALARDADASLEGKTNNPFNMKDKLYNTKIKPTEAARKNADEGRTYENSPEYDDLRLFLDVCKEQNMEVLLVMLPVNGWWYDYTGFAKEKRETFVTGVHAIAEEYGAKTADFFDESYTYGFLEDVVHPAGKGWVKINEAAYKFYNEN